MRTTIAIRLRKLLHLRWDRPIFANNWIMDSHWSFGYRLRPYWLPRCVPGDAGKRYMLSLLILQLIFTNTISMITQRVEQPIIHPIATVNFLRQKLIKVVRVCVCVKQRRTVVSVFAQRPIASVCHFSSLKLHQHTKAGPFPRLILFISRISFFLLKALKMRKNNIEMIRLHACAQEIGRISPILSALCRWKLKPKRSNKVARRFTFWSFPW